MRSSTFAAAVAATLLTACHSSPVAPDRGLTAGALAGQLQQQGLSVSNGGTMSRDVFPFFAVPATRLIVNGNDVQVFEFGSTSLAESEAAKVAPSGSPIGTSQISWIAPPRFYRKDRLIVLYVGSQTDIIQALMAVLGAPFVGPPR